VKMMKYTPPTPEEVRAFCAKHAFKIGVTFNDEFLSKWIRTFVRHAARSTSSFLDEYNWRLWILASVCRECCEHPPQGRDPHGYAFRNSFSNKFSSIVLRHEI
jgi:hypothetical protein